MVNGGRTLETTFIDNGDPVPEEDLGRLFDPFYVRANTPEELGTNLMACYLTVFHHGGAIRPSAPRMAATPSSSPFPPHRAGRGGRRSRSLAAPALAARRLQPPRHPVRIGGADLVTRPTPGAASLAVSVDKGAGGGHRLRAWP